ncbi:hypothetical protein NFI96_028495 [Prochilodus magdalenae]|nr:hypothetical protein NFI96_028495 [Prochilodus magdalenae]
MGKRGKGEKDKRERGEEGWERHWERREQKRREGERKERRGEERERETVKRVGREKERERREERKGREREERQSEREEKGERQGERERKERRRKREREREKRRTERGRQRERERERERREGQRERKREREREKRRRKRERGRVRREEKRREEKRREEKRREGQREREEKEKERKRKREKREGERERERKREKREGERGRERNRERRVGERERRRKREREGEREKRRRERGREEERGRERRERERRRKREREERERGIEREEKEREGDHRNGSVTQVGFYKRRMIPNMPPNPPPASEPPSRFPDCIHQTCSACSSSQEERRSRAPQCLYRSSISSLTPGESVTVCSGVLPRSRCPALEAAEFSCSVSTYLLNSSRVQTSSRESAGFFAGIKFVPDVLQIREDGQEHVLSVHSTVPISCYGSEPNRPCRMTLQLSIHEPDSVVAAAPNVALSSCQLELISQACRDGVCAHGSVTATAVTDFSRDGNRPSFLTARPSAASPRLWRGYAPAALKITVQDVPTSSCYSLTDPHVLTLDGR